MTYYPKTDEDWEKLAECIVTKHSGISPEVVGGLVVDATQTIFTWYREEGRHNALHERKYARDRLMELAKEAGCTSEGRTWPEELSWRVKSGFGELHRPFPETYGDWVNLAEDIKTRYADDPVDRAAVNYNLKVIAEEDGVTPMVEQSEVDDAKRWLIQKAGELGIS